MQAAISISLLVQQNIFFTMKKICSSLFLNIYQKQWKRFVGKKSFRPPSNCIFCATLKRKRLQCLIGTSPLPSMLPHFPARLANTKRKYTDSHSHNMEIWENGDMKYIFGINQLIFFQFWCHQSSCGTAPQYKTVRLLQHLVFGMIKQLPNPGIYSLLTNVCTDSWLIDTLKDQYKSLTRQFTCRGLVQ